MMETEKRASSSNGAGPRTAWPTAADIQAWLVAYLADMHGVAPAGIDVTASFDRLGVDSTAAVVLTGDLEDWLGADVEPTLPYVHPTIEALAQYLAARVKGEA